MTGNARAHLGPDWGRRRAMIEKAQACGIRLSENAAGQPVLECDLVDLESFADLVAADTLRHGVPA